MRFAFVACLFLSGCASGLIPDYDPVVENADVSVLRVHLTSLDVQDMLYEGIRISNERCDRFFEDLDHLRGKSDFLLLELATLSTGLPPILRAAGESSEAIANVAAALGFATTTTKNYQELFLLAEFKPPIYAKWQAARQIQKGRIDAWLRGGNTSLSEGKLYLYEYTRMCMTAQLKQWLHDSGNVGVAASPVVGAPFALKSMEGRFGREVEPGPIVFR